MRSRPLTSRNLRRLRRTRNSRHKARCRISPLVLPQEQKAQIDSQRSGQLSQFETTGVGQDQSLGEIRLMGRYTEVNGDQTRSFRDPGFNDLAEFNYFMDRRLGVTRRVQGLTQLRATNDNSIDPERTSFQKAFVRIYGPKDEYIFGDALHQLFALGL